MLWKYQIPKQIGFPDYARARQQMHKTKMLDDLKFDKNYLSYYQLEISNLLDKIFYFQLVNRFIKNNLKKKTFIFRTKRST